MPPSNTPTLKAKPDEKDVELLDYSTAINQLNVIAKKELEETKNQITVENYNLAMLRDRRQKESSDLESWKRAEKLKFTNDLTLRQNEIIANQNRINGEVLQQERITADLRTAQTKFETLNQDRLKLKEDMVKIEGKKIEVSDMLKQAESRHAQVLSAQNQGAMALARAEEETQKNKQENIRLVALNDMLTRQQNKLTEDMNSFAELRDFVEPKLRAIKDQQDALDTAQNANMETIGKLQQTMQEEKILLQSVNDKRAKLEADMKIFDEKKQDSLRELLLIKASIDAEKSLKPVSVSTSQPSTEKTKA